MLGQPPAYPDNDQNGSVAYLTNGPRDADQVFDSAVPPASAEGHQDTGQAGLATPVVTIRDASPGLRRRRNHVV